jgi:glycosyltransferase involved in cell wall biosynthesis
LEEVRQAATGLRPDVVHLHGWGTAQLARLVPGVPTVHVAVDSWALGLRNRIVSPVHRVLDAGQASRVAAHEARHYPALGAVVVVAERDAAHIRAGAPGAQVHVVPNGVDAGSEPAPEAWKERPLPVIAFHGVFSTRANVDAATTLLRDVLPRIRAGRPDVRLLLIGKAFAPDLRGLAEDAGAEVREDVASVRPELERAAVYVAPLVSGSGIKNKVLEAMAAGLPVVTTRLGLDGIGAGDGVVEADHPEELADAALRLIREPGLAARTGRAGRERVRAGFGWDRNAGAIANIWDKMRDRA